MKKLDIFGCIFIILLFPLMTNSQVVITDIDDCVAVEGQSVIFPWTYTFTSGSLAQIEWLIDRGDGAGRVIALLFDGATYFPGNGYTLSTISHIKDGPNSAKLEISSVGSSDLGTFTVDVAHGGTDDSTARLVQLVKTTEIDKTSVTCTTESFTDDTEKNVGSSCIDFTVNIPSGLTHPYNVTFTNANMSESFSCSAGSCGAPSFTAMFTDEGDTVHILVEHLLCTPNVTSEFRAKYRAETTTDSPDTTTTQPIPTTDDKDPSPGPTQPPVTSDSPTKAPTGAFPPWWAWLVLALGLLLLLVLIVVGCMCCEGCPGYKRRQRKQMKRGVYIDERVPPQPHDQPYGQPHSQVARQPQGYPPGYPSGQSHGYSHTQHSNGRGVSVHRDHRQDDLSMQPRGQPSVVTMKTNDQRPATATAYSNQGYTPEPAPDYGDGTARITVSGRY